MEILISLLLFSLPMGVVARIEIVRNAYIYIQDILAFLIFLIVIFNVYKKKIYVTNNLFKILWTFITIGFISLIINSSMLTILEFLVSLSYLVRFISYSSLIFIPIFLSKKYLTTINKKLLLIGEIFVLLGYIQFVYYPDLGNLFYLGWDIHLGRLFSTFLDPNFAGAFLVLFILLISQNLMIAKDNVNKYMYKIYLLIPLWIVTLIAILLTYSRSAVIMLLVGLGIILYFNKLRKFMIFCSILIVALVVLFSNTKVEGLNPLRVASSEARLVTANQAISIVAKKPILGVGFNAYRYAQIKYGTRSAYGASLSNADAGTDNSFLFVLVTTGIVGLVVFVYFWIKILKFAYQGIRDNEPYAILVFASLISLFVDSLFINSLFYIPIMAWLFMIIGLMYKKTSMI